MATNQKPKCLGERLPIPASSFATAPDIAVPMAGLLHEQPALVDAVKPAAEWQKLLDAYLTSPRPAPDPEPDPVVEADPEA